MNEYKINNGLFSYIVNKAKCRHLKNLTCKGTLRQLFIRVYRLDIHSVKLIFSTQLCELLPLQPSLWFNSTQPPPCVNKCTVYIGREGGLRQINTYRKVPLLVNFLMTTFCFGVYLTLLSLTGGGICLTYAATFPDQISTLIMLDITFLPIR
jgi:hypothetical protein